MSQSPIPNPQSEIVVIGASKGGMQALRVLLGALPSGFPRPVVVVLHRERDHGGMLHLLLQTYTSLPVEEPEDKQAILSGYVYIASADYHLLIDCGMRNAEYGRTAPHSPLPTPRSYHFSLSADPPVEYARPSVDVLFQSAADAYRDRAIGVILTGANRDGAAGLAAIRARGGLAVVQDPTTADTPSMPEAALAVVSDATVLPLEAIGPWLVERCGR